MEFDNSVDLLNQLLVIHYRSLPMYLTEAVPWTHRGDEKATDTLRDIVANQRDTCARLAHVVSQRGGIPELGDFPMVYTDLHFLSLDFLLRQLVAVQQTDIKAIEQIADRLNFDPPAEAIAKEALGAAKGHLQSLQELATELSGTS